MEVLEKHHIIIANHFLFKAILKQPCLPTKPRPVEAATEI